MAKILLATELDLIGDINLRDHKVSQQMPSCGWNSVKQAPKSKKVLNPKSYFLIEIICR